MRMPKLEFDGHDKKYFERALQCYKEITGVSIPLDEFATEFYQEEHSLNYHLGTTDGRVLDAFVLLLFSARHACRGAGGFREAGLLAARASELLLAADKNLPSHLS
jgi:hypothetical protein